jgi:hypothetical protein
MSSIRVVLLALCLVTVLPLHAAITISIDGRTVTAQGLTPGGGAVLFSVGHEPQIAYTSIRRVAEYIADDEGDGVVSYTAAADVPWKSVWFVVDAATGRYAAGTRAESRDRLTTERRSRVRGNANGELSVLVHERPWLELLVIRPGGDVWELTAMRGGAADREKLPGPDYATAVGLFRPIRSGARPLERLNQGDVVIAVDPEEVEYFVVTVE